MNFAEKVNETDKDVLVAVFLKFLESYHNPAFGTLPKREIDLLVFELMRDLKLIEAEATAYSLMTDLRVTRTKAMQLLFDYDVRKRGGDKDGLDEEVKKIIRSSHLIQDGNYVVLEIENPLVHAHLKSLVQRAKHISDSSFSPSIVRLTPEALEDVLALLWKDGVEKKLIKELKDQGLINDNSWKGQLRPVFKFLKEKSLNELAELFDALASANIPRIVKVIADAVS